MKRRWSKWFLGTIAVTLMAMVVVGIVAPTPVEAASRSGVISRGQEKIWFLNPGDILTVYYYPDGQPSTVAWKNNWFYWLNNNPSTYINIYCASGFNGPWYWMYVDSVAPYYRSLPLRLSKGAYKFVIKNYTKGDIVYLKVY